MKKTKKIRNYQKIIKFSWRTAWYGVLVWMLSFLIGGVVMLPWFYVVYPAFILLVSVFYFGKFNNLGSGYSLPKRVFFAQGLSAGFFWFFAIFIFDFVQFVGIDFSGAEVYFLDSRNFIRYPITILIPIIYALILENQYTLRGGVKRRDWLYPVQ